MYGLKKDEDSGGLQFASRQRKQQQRQPERLCPKQPPVERFFSRPSSSPTLGAPPLRTAALCKHLELPKGAVAFWLASIAEGEGSSHSPVSAGPLLGRRSRRTSNSSDTGTSHRTSTDKSMLTKPPTGGTPVEEPQVEQQSQQLVEEQPQQLAKGEEADEPQQVEEAERPEVAEKEEGQVEKDKGNDGLWKDFSGLAYPKLAVGRALDERTSEDDNKVKSHASSFSSLKEVTMLSYFFFTTNFLHRWNAFRQIFDQAGAAVTARRSCRMMYVH
eukprot:GHVT01093766.1.p1 GENE.GHVT01093766.1~~GHVT01093766.1.p1  ORF type:complete len:273 (+),score=53.99 GHVT01093766.1:467-1285(+)